jgi:hypothetical protein
MPRERTTRGTVVQHEEAVWEPLRAAVGLYHADWFMWMFEIELADGSRVHSYKHIHTRRYLHLDGEGHAFVYCGDHLYREIDLDILVDLVIDGFDPADDP